MWAFVATGISLVAAIASLVYAWFAWRHARDAKASALAARRLEMDLIAGDPCEEHGLPGCCCGDDEEDYSNHWGGD